MNAKLEEEEGSCVLALAITLRGWSLPDMWNDTGQMTREMCQISRSFDYSRQGLDMPLLFLSPPMTTYRFCSQAQVFNHDVIFVAN